MKINALTFRGGVNTSNNATFRLCDLKSNLMFLLRRIKNKTLCHAELVSASHDVETLKRVQGDKVFNTPSYHSAEQNNPVNCFVRGFCGILMNIFKKIPQCVSLMRDDIKIRHTFKKALAFTLAETLIVMGIIGVVAALTIPNLNSSTAEKEKVAKVKKVYAQLNEAMTRAIAVYGPIDEWSTDNDKYTVVGIRRTGDRLTEFMKLSKNCEMSTDKGCFSNGQKLDGFNDLNLDAANYAYKFILADGTSIAITAVMGSRDYFVKIDGPKSKIVNGKNLFWLSQNGAGAEGTLLEDIIPIEKHSEKIGDHDTVELCLSAHIACVSWVLDYDNMDYLKADENGKCPNGKILDGTTNTSCK